MKRYLFAMLITGGLATLVSAKPTTKASPVPADTTVTLDAFVVDAAPRSPLDVTGLTGHLPSLAVGPAVDRVREVPRFALQVREHPIAALVPQLVQGRCEKVVVIHGVTFPGGGCPNTFFT